MSNETNVNNYLGMARSALLAGNNDEALSYFNRVLEVDPTVSEAWLGKGKAAAWQSSLSNIRINEAKVAFSHAIANAAPDQKASVTEQAVGEINGVAVALYSMARRHLDEFVAIDGSWATYLEQSAQLINALEEARTWSPQNQQLLENIVHLCKDNIEGVSYRNFDNTPGAWHLSPDYEAALKAKLDSAASDLKLLNPSYVSPAVEKKQSAACFVVTATMGDGDHPTVRFMRQFRDEWLQQYGAGRRLTSLYYRHGPKAASFISKSDRRRKVSYAVVVWPAERLARILMGRRLRP